MGFWLRRRARGREQDTSLISKHFQFCIRYRMNAVKVSHSVPLSVSDIRVHTHTCACKAHLPHTHAALFEPLSIVLSSWYSPSHSTAFISKTVMHLREPLICGHCSLHSPTPKLQMFYFTSVFTGCLVEWRDLWACSDGVTLGTGLTSPSLGFSVRICNRRGSRAFSI